MPDSPSDALATRRRRLLFRATHRGTHENDLMIGGFVRVHLAAFGADELDALEALLESPETDLADWLTGRRPMPDDAPTMLRRMRAAVMAGGADRTGTQTAPPPALAPPGGPSPQGEGEAVAP